MASSVEMEGKGEFGQGLTAMQVGMVKSTHPPAEIMRSTPQLPLESRPSW